MHDALALAAHFLADGGGATSVEYALIAAVALVLSTLLPAVLNRGRKEPRVIRDLRATEQKLRDELEHDRDYWKGVAEERQLTINNAMHGMELRKREEERLLKLLMVNAINPYPDPEPQRSEPET